MIFSVSPDADRGGFKRRFVVVFFFFAAPRIFFSL